LFVAHLIFSPFLFSIRHEWEHTYHAERLFYLSIWGEEVVV